MQPINQKPLTLNYKTFVDNNRSLKGFQVEHYRVIDFIGKGVYSQVYKAIDTQQGPLVALKVLDKYNLNRTTNNAHIRAKINNYIHSQGILLSKFQHNNILPLLAVYESQQLKIIVTKYCRHGTLREEIQKIGIFEENHAINIIEQLAYGISEMHKKLIFHRDLKSENIFKHNGHYIIGDFGFAKYFEQNSYPHTNCGSETAAPQVSTGKYTLSADIWSLGALFLQMIAGNAEYMKRKNQIIKEQIQAPFTFKLKDGRCPSLKTIKFLQKTLTIPENRFNWTNLIKHPIFKHEQSQKGISNIYQITVKPICDLNVSQLNIFSNVYCSTIMIDTNEEQQQILKIKQQHFTISEITQTQNLRPITDKQDDIYDNLCEFHLRCKITDYIFTKYIKPIEQQKILDLNTKINVQLLYLLASRCFFDLSYINNHAKTLSQIDFSEQIKQFANEYISQLYNKIKIKFDHYSKQLTNQQNKYGNIIKEKIRWSGKFYREDITLFEGIQGIQFDFQRQKQIAVTQKYLDNVVIDDKMFALQLNLRKQEFQKQFPKKKDKILNRFKKYTNINNITLQDIEEYGFDKTVRIVLGSK